MKAERIAEPGLVRRALAGHAAVGLLAAALIYIISLSGTLVVIHDRWQRWEQPGITETAVLPPRAAQAAMEAVVAGERGKPATTHLYVRMPTEDLPRAVVTTDNGAWYVDGEGRPVAREGNAWTEFLIALHEYLNLPSTWGIMLVGALGVALASLSLTGVLAHPRIVRDAFRLRLRQDPQIARADWHNRLGVWTLPFIVAVALTGAIIGLGNIGFSLLSSAYHGGDIEKAYAPVFGREPAADAARAPLPDIAAALAALRARVPQASPTYVIVHDPATRGQHVQIIAEHPHRLIYGETYAFGARGEWHGPTGLADGALGQQAAASTYNLHFGNYGGLAVELAYILFGIALCVVTATGTSLWLQKRRRRGLASPRLTACWDMLVWGTPLLIVCAVWLRAAAGAEAPLAAFFWGGLAVGLVAAVVWPHRIGATRLRAILLVSIIATSAVHLAAFSAAPAPVRTIDLVLLAGAAAVLIATRPRRTAKAVASADAALVQQ